MSRSYLDLTPAVMSVAMMPGLISYTPMPRGARAWAKRVAAMLRAALDMQYSARAVEDTTAEIEVMKTMQGGAPLPASRRPIIRLAAFWVRKKAPRALTDISRSQLSAVVSRISLLFAGATPALLTRTSSRPNSPSTASSMSSWAPMSATSPPRGKKRRPSASTVFLTSNSPFFVLRGSKTMSIPATSKPSRANSMTMPRPMPRPAPVTTATGPGLRALLVTLAPP